MRIKSPPRRLVFDCICLDNKVNTVLSETQSSQLPAEAHSESEPRPFSKCARNIRTGTWDLRVESRDFGTNKIRRSESHRLQTSHDVGGGPTVRVRSLRSRVSTLGGADPGASPTAEAAPPRLLLFPSPRRRPRPQTQTLRAAGARDLPVVARAERCCCWLPPAWWPSCCSSTWCRRSSAPSPSRCPARTSW